MAIRLARRSTVAVCQMTATNNKKENLNICAELIKSAKEKNCVMVFLPEACDYIGESKEETLAMAEPLSGDLVKNFCNFAKESKIWLSLGGLHEQVTDKIVKNCHVVIDDKGQIVGVYRKAHLFDVNLPEQGIRLMESDYVLPGKEIVSPIPTPIGNVGLSVCYDIRFPEQSLTLTKMDADILTFPSAFTFVTGSAHWSTLLRARAIESQCYVIAAAQTGAHNKKRTSWGHAMIVDPWGSIVAECSEDKKIVTAEIDLDYIQRVRTAMPVWNHRRNDLYRSLTPKKSEEDQEIKFGNVTVNSERIIYKSAHAVAFVSCNSIVPGHVLVSPLRYVTKLSDLNTEESVDMFYVVMRIQKVFQSCYNVSANVVYIRDGCKHLHVHVLPRRPNDFVDTDMIYPLLDSHDELLPADGNVADILREAKSLQDHIKTI